MALPALPFAFPDPTSAFRRIAETINNILNFQFDDSRRPRAAEIAAGVTPTNCAYASGPYRYGAAGNQLQDDTRAWNDLGLVGGYQFALDGTYLVSSRITLNNFVTVEGAGRQNCELVAASSLADYMVVVGTDSGTSANVGEIRRLKFSANASTRACLYMANEANMWRLDCLVFSGPCPGLILNNVWDSNYTNLDFISSTPVAGVNPATGASVIVKNGSNNIYFRGLRVESAAVGAIYVDPTCGPIHIDAGKVDNHFNTQSCAAVTVDGSGVDFGTLFVDYFEITGIAGQYPFSVKGFLRLGRHVIVDGSTGGAAILDKRAWAHVDNATVPGATASSFGPVIAPLDLGGAYFIRANRRYNATTPAAVHSRIYPLRAVNRVKISSNGAISGNAITVVTSLTAAANDLFNGCYLVHNPTGTQSSGEAGARRKILQSFANGQLTLQGTWSATLDGEWSVEYCGRHATPIEADGIALQQGMTLFDVIATGVSLASPSYVSTNGNDEGGTTVITLSGGLGLPAAGTSLTGVFLLDEVTGEPFYINWGMNAHSRCGIMYDRTATLDAAHAFSLVAGYDANVKQNGSSYEWSFAGQQRSIPISAANAAGFDRNNLPLWESGTSGEPVNLPAKAFIPLDASAASEFIITARSSSAFAISNPVNPSAGQKIDITISNASGGALEAVSWGNAFKIPSLEYPATGYQRTYAFRYNRANAAWYFLYASGTDVPN